MMVVVTVDNGVDRGGGSGGDIFSTWCEIFVWLYFFFYLPKQRKKLLNSNRARWSACASIHANGSMIGGKPGNLAVKGGLERCHVQWVIGRNQGWRSHIIVRWSWGRCRSVFLGFIGWKELPGSFCRRCKRAIREVVLQTFLEIIFKARAFFPTSTLLAPTGRNPICCWLPGGWNYRDGAGTIIYCTMEWWEHEGLVVEKIGRVWSRWRNGTSTRESPVMVMFLDIKKLQIHQPSTLQLDSLLKISLLLELPSP